MLNPHIEVRGSAKHGRGLFATASIRAGAFIWRHDADEKYYTQAEIDALTEPEQKNFYNYSYQVAPDQFYGTPQGNAGDDADYMNHACDPNCWFEADGSMTARRDILPDEEITYDYATSEGRAEFALVCRCKSPLCRGTIKGSDMKTNTHLRERYFGHVMAHTLG